jgi:3-deoxy-D-manno-octulosonate 8-phosphate phosphatase (KDO 8-P phosphatase)
MASLLEPELYTLFSQIKLLVLDVDGVLTDGGLFYAESGEELKKFNVKDGMGIKLLQKAGIEVAIISASNSTATLHRARKLGISHAFIGVENKLEILETLCDKLKLPFSQVAHIGDDVNDLPIFQVIGVPLTVADAMPINRAKAKYITQNAGGQGAVREVCDLILSAVQQSKD